MVFYHHGKVVAEHVRSQRKGQHTSLSAHMLAHHQALLEWSPERLQSWAGSIGPYTEHWVYEFIRQAEHPAQSVRPCLALLDQSKTYGKDRLEAACLRGHLTGANRLHNIRAMLKNGLEQQPIYSSKQTHCKPSVTTTSMAKTTSTNNKEIKMQLRVDEQLSQLRLGGIKQALAQQEEQAMLYQNMGFEERLQLLLSHELQQREQRKINRLETQARFRLMGEIE
ncbi:DNA replication protein [Shewanella putrefaciens]|nr:DNA replication protein [Shewanella putrefaciens]